MNKALPKDKEAIVDILVAAFADNKSVNYIIRDGGNQEKNLMALMGYSFELCMLYGEVFITDDRKGCALVLMPEKKKTSLKSIRLDINLAFRAIGTRKILKTLQREAAIKKVQPAGSLYYLWFIGVYPQCQGEGIGTGLLKYLIERAKTQDRTICLETSTEKNLPWYKTFGFTIYQQLDFGFPLYCMKL